MIIRVGIKFIVNQFQPMLSSRGPEAYVASSLLLCFLQGPKATFLPVLLQTLIKVRIRFTEHKHPPVLNCRGPEAQSQFSLALIHANNNQGLKIGSF